MIPFKAALNGRQTNAVPFVALSLPTGFAAVRLALQPQGGVDGIPPALRW